MISTAREMYIAFLHGIQKEDAEGVPADKFKYWINKSQEEWMSERAKEFDSDQKRIDDLHVLRTERVIPINGTKAVTAVGSCKLDSTGAGTFVITEETYFKIMGLEFIKSSGAGAINSVTGVITGAEAADVYLCKVTYAELEQDDATDTTEATNDPIIVKLTVGATLASTHAAVQATSTDDYTLWNSASGESINTAPATSFTDYKFLIPNDYPNPRYFRLLNVLFKITYVDNALHDNGDISTWQRAYIMRADERADIYQNAYRYPSDEKMYYRFLEEHLELINETDSTPLKCKMEYFRYPNEIVYYEPTSDNEDVDCELAPVQQKEIVDMAVRMYLEATTNPRYQSQIAEDQMRDKFE